jgi:hypothetical protein
MSNVSSRIELIEYCYRALGAPLVEINITDEQADDIIDSCLSFFQEYYFDGITKEYVKHRVRELDIERGWIELPDHIFGVNRIFPMGGNVGQSNIFDMQYQLRMNDLRDLTSTSMVYYSQVMSHIALLDILLNTQKSFRWNKLTNKLFIDQNWAQKAVIDSWILIDCYAALDPDESPKFWDDRYLKKYATAKMKKQWGQNIKKFNGITLPGGITLDGQSMYEEGKQEAEDIEEELMNKQAPLEFVLG